jgi:hypothetical protein
LEANIMTTSHVWAAHKAAPATQKPSATPASPTSAARARAPVGRLYSAGPMATLGALASPGLTVGVANSPLEHEADRVADQVMAGFGAVQVQPAAAAFGVVSREEKDKPAAPTGGAAKEGEVGFGSPAAPWLVLRPLILQLPDRWKRAGSLSAGQLSLEDQALYYNFVTSLNNLLYAGILTQMSSYKPDFSQGLKAAESLSGVSNTYLNLVSFALQKDLIKYLGTEAKPAIKENLGMLILYGLFVQGGLVGMNAWLEEDLDFTTLLSPALKSFTEAPLGFGRPMLRPNVLDPRWSSYSFGSGPSGFESGIAGYADPTKPYTFNLKLGVNVASMADLYPEKEEDKAKYKGFELYPYLSFSHSWEKEGAKAPDFKNIWLAGLFVGGEGVYTLVEGGQKQKADDTIAETYLRSGLVFRNLGALQLGQLTSEYSLRPGGDLRARLNAAGSIKLVDTKTFEATLGAGIGGLLPSPTQPGALDVSGEAGLAHKSYRPDVKDPFKTGLSLGSTWRNQDPFDPASGRLFSLGSKLSVLDLVFLSAEYHQFSGGPPVPGLELPSQDVRFMLNLGPGVFRWK